MSKVQNANIGVFEGFYPLHHSGVVGRDGSGLMRGWCLMRGSPVCPPILCFLTSAFHSLSSHPLICLSNTVFSPSAFCPLSSHPLFLTRCPQPFDSHQLFLAFCLSPFVSDPLTPILRILGLSPTRCLSPASLRLSHSTLCRSHSTLCLSHSPSPPPPASPPQRPK